MLEEGDDEMSIEAFRAIGPVAGPVLVEWMKESETPWWRLRTLAEIGDPRLELCSHSAVAAEHEYPTHPPPTSLRAHAT